MLRRSATTIRNKSLPASTPRASSESTQPAAQSPRFPFSTGANPSILPRANKKMDPPQQPTNNPPLPSKWDPKKPFFSGTKVPNESCSPPRRVRNVWLKRDGVPEDVDPASWPSTVYRWAFEVRGFEWSGSELPPFWGEKWCKYDQICQI